MGWRPARLTARITGRWRWLAAAVGVILLLLVAVQLLAGEPLRRYIEHEMNRKMTGYTARIRALRFHLVGISWDLKDIVVFQNATPTPPVLRVPTLSASMSWWALLHGRLVSDFTLYSPVLYVNREQLLKETRDKVPVKDRGWQDALQAAHPFQINEFSVIEGDVTYVDVGQAKPLRMTKLNIFAHDIRNVRSDAETYPSPLHVDATLFDRGKLAIDGAADFLAEPYTSLKGRVDLQDLALDYFKPVLSHYNFDVKAGTLSAGGNIEYAPTIKVVELDRVRLDGFDASYTHKRNEGEATTKQAVGQTATAAKEVTNKPDTLIRVKELTASHSTFGFVDAEARPPFRVFLSDTDITVRNVSNQRTEGTATATLHGRFMGSGDTTMVVNFRPETNGPNFDLTMRVENTDLRTLNDFLRAHGKIDVASGLFSLYSQLGVKDGRVNGYVKPLFRNLKAYEKEKDRNKPAMARFKERAIDVAAKVLKNRARKEVATKTIIAGPLQSPKASTMQVLGNLLMNAFVRAILPGFDREVAREGAA